jgi:hypothetical protein
VAKLANRKVNTETIKEILDRYDSGETPADLATSYGVHPTTIRRYLRDNGRELSRVTHTTEIDPDVKHELRRVLSKFNVDNIDILISEIDKHFIIEKRQGEEDDAFEIIHL